MTLIRTPEYPDIATPRPYRAAIRFDDFTNVSWGKRLLPVGELATPETATHKTNIGGTSWEVNETTTAGGSAAGPIGSSDGPEYGIFYMKCGHTANDIIRVYPGSINDFPVTWARLNSLQWTFSFRFRFGPASAGESATTSSIRGWGFVDEGLNGNTWVADPATSLATYPGLVVTRHSSVYGGAAGGALVARAYPTNQLITLVTPALFSGTTWYKVECTVAPITRTATWYLNGIYKGTMTDISIADGTGMYPTAECQTLTAAGRNISVDYFYSEQDVGSSAR